MAVIPVGQFGYKTSGESANVDVPALAGTQYAGRAALIGGASDAIDREVARQREVNDAYLTSQTMMAAADANVAQTEASDRVSQKVLSGEIPATHEDVAAAFDDETKDIGEQYSSKVAQRFLPIYTQHLANTNASLRLNLSRVVMDKQQQDIRANMEEQVGNYLAGYALDPQATKAKASILVADQGPKSGMTPLEVQQRIEKIGQDGATSYLYSLATGPLPMSAVSEISSGRFDADFARDPVKKWELLNTALNHATMLSNLEYTQSEREQKQTQDAYARTAQGLMNAGKLSVEWLDRNANNLSPTEYTTFSNKMNGYEEHTSPEVYGKLRLAQASGADVTDEANQAYQARQIKREDLDRLVLVDDAPKPYRAAEDYIKSQLAASPFVAGFDQQSKRQGAALDDFYTWAQKNTDATPQAHRAEAEYLVRAYSAPRPLQTLRFPVYLQDTPHFIDVTASAAALQRAKDAKKISPADAAADAAVLRAWDDYMRYAPEAP